MVLDGMGAAGGVKGHNDVVNTEWFQLGMGAAGGVVS